MEKDFFKNQTASSRIKAKIVAEYFPHYASILLKKPQKAIRYIDLFAGPGIYEDQNHSTPLLIAKACAENPKLRDKVHLIFNDKNYSNQLRHNFIKFFPSGTFKFEPQFRNKTVGEDEDIKKYLLQKPTVKNLYPTLLFFDPWGYKGIDSAMLANFLCHWGNELFLFVNVKRIHAAIENEKFDELMQSLFPTSIELLRKNRKYEASVYDRLNLIMENLASEFERIVKGKGKFYHCSFQFQEEDSNATSHFVIHFCKHKKGFELVKQVYDEFDNIGAVLEKDGTYTFDAKRSSRSSDSAINFGDANIQALAACLQSEYKGENITGASLFDGHHERTKYSPRHYVAALRLLVEKKIITATYSDQIKHKVPVLLTNHCKLQFS